MSKEHTDGSEILPSPPFIVVEGVINFRDIGGYSTSDPNLVVKSGTLFRAGELSRLSDQGKDQLRALGIKRVYDLRSDSEIASWKSGSPPMDDVEFIRVPVSQKDAYDPVSLAKRLAEFETDETESFVRLYTEILESGVPAFKVIFTHLRDRPHEPALVHCTAGKDRTGLMSALLFMLLGVGDEDVVNEYALTTLGLAPFLPMLIARFEKEAVYRDNRHGAMNMGSARPQTMVATMKMIRERFGGADGYLKAHAGFSDEDLEMIRRNMLVPKHK